jgi:hypothetical protein
VGAATRGGGEIEEGGLRQGKSDQRGKVVVETEERAGTLSSNESIVIGCRSDMEVGFVSNTFRQQEQLGGSIRH